MSELIHKIEKHPFIPFLPEGCKVVLCGTFPPKPDKWAMDFFYPNFQNDMWRIFGSIFCGDKEKFFNKEKKTINKEGIQDLLTEHKIGIGETVKEAIRLKDNASDKFLEVIKPVDLQELLSLIPDCDNLVTTGEKAAGVISELTSTIIPKVGDYTICLIKMNNGELRQFRHWRMPSTSRAYPLSFEKKKEAYENLFRSIGII